MDSMAMTTMAAAATTAAASTTAAAAVSLADDGRVEELDGRRRGQGRDQSRRRSHGRRSRRYLTNLYRSLLLSALTVVTTIGYHHVHLIRNIIDEQREIDDYHDHHQQQQQQQQQTVRMIRRMKNDKGSVASPTKETDKKEPKSEPELSDWQLLQNTTTTATEIEIETEFEPIDVPSFVRPTNGNTLVALIAMGKSAESFIVHRCIRSLRTSGEFDGHVMVLTDPDGFQHLNSTMGWDPSTRVVRGRDEDMVPRWNNGTTINYRQITMIYKRYKTLLGKYVSNDPQLDRVIDYMMYIDVDNVVTRPFRTLLDDYYDQLPSQWLNASRDLGMDKSTSATTSALPQFSFWSFWKDPSNKKRWQGGQTLHHRRYSEQCSITWRYEMDTNPEEIFDQPLLLRALKKSRSQFQQQQQQQQSNNNSSNNHHFPVQIPCVVFSLPDPKIHFGYATSGILMQTQQSDENTTISTTSTDQDDSNLNSTISTTTSSRRRSSQTLVHITSARTRKFNGHDQIDFIRRAMHLSNDTFATLEGNETYMVPGVVLWRDVAVPIGANNEHPPGFKLNKKPKTQKTKKMLRPEKQIEQQKNNLVQRYLQSKQQQKSKHFSSSQSQSVLASPPLEPAYERKTSSRK